MKKMTLIALTAVSSLVAGGWSDCGSDCCYGFSVGAEALYMKPCGGVFRYGRVSTGVENPSVKYLDLVVDYDWGVRIFGRLSDECECNFADLEWAYLRASTSVSRNSPTSQYVIAGSPTSTDLFLRAKQTIRYNKVSLKLGHQFCGNRCNRLYGYVGGRWIEIQQRNSSLGIQTGPNVNTVNIKKQFNGGAFEAGVSMHSDIWCGFGLSARLGGIAAIGERKFSANVVVPTTTTADANFSGQNTACIFGAELRVGIDYTYACDCWWIRGEIGYENNYYFDALYGPKAFAPGDLAVADNFGVGGIFFGLTVGF